MWGEAVAFGGLRRGGRSWGKSQHYGNPLEGSSKEHLHVSTARTDKSRLTSDLRCSSHACGCRALPLSFTLSLTGVPTSRASSSSVNDSAAALNALANVSVCNGGCQHHLDSIHQAPTWGQRMSLIINPNDGLGLGLLQRDGFVTLRFSRAF